MVAARMFLRMPEAYLGRPILVSAIDHETLRRGNARGHPERSGFSGGAKDLPGTRLVARRIVDC